MEIGTRELQLFVCLLEFVLAAFLALLCDYLKGTIERLREYATELSVRDEEKLTHQPTWLQHLIGTPGKNRIRLGGMRNMAVAGIVPQPEAAQPVMESSPVAQLSSEQRRDRAPRHRKPVETGANNLLDTLPKPAWLQEEQNARVFAGPDCLPEPAVVAMEYTAFTPPWVEVNAPKLVQRNRRAANSETRPIRQPNFTNDRGIDEQDASAKKKMEVALMQPVRTSGTPPPVTTLELPAGFVDRSVFTGLLLRTEVINAVVVSISVNDYGHHVEKLGRSGLQNLQNSVEESIRSLLTSDDMGCRTSDDEFILVLPNLAGPDVQRRLNSISERLWGFQLRSLNSFAVVFSWGAVEVQSETLADAVASATEKMYKTKRNGKTVDIGRSRRLA